MIITNLNLEAAKSAASAINAQYGKDFTPGARSAEELAWVERRDDANTAIFACAQAARKQAVCPEGYRVVAINTKSWATTVSCPDGTEIKVWIAENDSCGLRMVGNQVMDTEHPLWEMSWVG